MSLGPNKFDLYLRGKEYIPHHYKIIRPLEINSNHKGLIQYNSLTDIDRLLINKVVNIALGKIFNLHVQSILTVQKKIFGRIRIFRAGPQAALYAYSVSCLSSVCL